MDQPGSGGAPPPPTVNDVIAPDFIERRKQTLTEWIVEIDSKHDAAHIRLRDGLTALTAQVSLLAGEHKTFQAAVKTLADASIESSRLRFTPGTLFTFFSTVLLLGGLVWTLRSDVRDLATKSEISAKLQDERYNNLNKAVERAENQRLADKAEAARLLQQYDNAAMARDLAQQKQGQGVVKK